MMTNSANTHEDTGTIRQILEAWAENTRTGRLHQILDNHDDEVLIYDVLAPMKYEGKETYRRSWGDWHPDTPDDGHFDLQDVVITTASDLAFATAFILCGGTSPDGKVFSDTVRATFCLRKTDGLWKIHHQHISKPLGLKST